MYGLKPVCGFKAKLENFAQISSTPCLEITHESYLLLSTPSAQTFPLSSSISFSLSVRQTVCRADKYSHPEIHSSLLQVLFRCKSLHRSEKKRSLDQLHHCLFWNSSSGAALYSPPEPFTFHRG